MLPFLSPTGTLRGQGALRRTLLSTTAGVSLPAATYSADFKTLTSMPTWATFSRGSNATMFDSGGNRTFGPNNLLLQSNNFANASWNTDAAITVTSGVSDPDGGTNAFTLTNSAGSGAVQMSQSQGFGSGNVINSIWIRLRTGTSGNFVVTSPAAGNTFPSLTGSWQRLSIPAACSGFFTFQIIIFNPGDQIDIYRAQSEAVTFETTARAYNETTTAPYYGPRFGYEYRGGSWARGGLVFEGVQSSNVIPGDVGTSMLIFDAVFDQPGTTIAGKTAWRMRVDGDADGTPSDLPAGFEAGLYFFGTFAASNTGLAPSSFSIDYKYTGQRYIAVSLVFSNAGTERVGVIFDLAGITDQDPTSTDTTTHGVLVYAKAKYRGNGEWRLFLTAKSSVAVADNAVEAVVTLASGPTDSWDAFGDVINSDIIPVTTETHWLDPMLEVGAWRSSQEFIPPGSTRAADLITLADPVASLLDNPFSFAASFRQLFSQFEEFSDLFAFDNYLEFSTSNYNSFAGTPRTDYNVQLWSGSTAIDGPNIHNPETGLSNRIAFADNGISGLVAANGVQSQSLQGGTNTDIQLRGGVGDPAYLGGESSYDGFMGWIEKVDFWNSALSSSDLAGVSA